MKHLLCLQHSTSKFIFSLIWVGLLCLPQLGVSQTYQQKFYKSSTADFYNAYSTGIIHPNNPNYFEANKSAPVSGKYKGVVSIASFQEPTFSGLYVLKTDQNGNEEWDKNILVSNGSLVAEDLIIVNEKRYLVSAHRTVTSPGFQIYQYLIMFDENGGVVWDRKILANQPLALAKNSNTIIVAGGDAGPMNYSLLDFNGNLVGGFELDLFRFHQEPREIIVTEEDNFLMVAQTNTTNNPSTTDRAIILTEIDPKTGEAYWVNEIPMPYAALQVKGICKAIDGKGYIISGGVRNANNTPVAILIYVDYKGQVIWSRLLEIDPVETFIRDAISYFADDGYHPWLTIVGQTRTFSQTRPFVAQFEAGYYGIGLNWYRIFNDNAANSRYILRDVYLVNNDYEEINEEIPGFQSFLLYGGQYSTVNSFSSWSLSIMETDLDGNLDGCAFDPDVISLDPVNHFSQNVPYNQDKFNSFSPIGLNPLNETTLEGDCSGGGNISFRTFKNKKVESLKTSLGQIELYPNPAEDQFQIVSKMLELKRIKIFDMTGKLFMSRETSGFDIQLSVENLPPGMYSIKIEGQNGRFFNEKLMVK